MYFLIYQCFIVSSGLNTCHIYVMFRLLLDRATGVLSGSIYNDRSLARALPGELVCDKSVSVIKVSGMEYKYICDSMKFVLYILIFMYMYICMGRSIRTRTRGSASCTASNRATRTSARGRNTLMYIYICYITALYL